MAVEEPSVIGMTCNSAKIIKENGGFKASIKRKVSNRANMYL